MAHTSTGRLLATVVALAALSLAGGCIFIDAQFGLDPDGAQHARLEAGVLQSVVEQGEGEFTSDISEGLAPGKWQDLGEETRGQWLVRTMVGQAAPGEALFTDEAEVAPEFGVTGRLLSTAYTFTMALPEETMQPQMGPVELQPEAEAPAAEAPAEGGEGGEGEVQFEGMDEAMSGMMAMMMSSGEAGLRFSADLPGAIVSTNGEIAALGRAAWAIDFMNPDPELRVLEAESRLLNWPSIGRLAGEMTALGRWDLAPALIASVRRGVVPDPVTADPMAAQLNTAMYVQVLEIMVALDQAVGEQITNEVMTTLGLNADDVDPAFVEGIAVRLEGMDLAAEVDANVTEQLLGTLGGG